MLATFLHDSLFALPRLSRFTKTRLTLRTRFLLLIIALSSQFLYVRSLHAQCPTCAGGAFEEFKQIRQEQILRDLLKKLDLSAKPNVTVDFDNLPPIGRNNPRIQAMIDQTIRTTHRRVRKPFKSTQSWGTEEPDYFPALYETEQEPAPQSSYIIAQSMPKWFDQDGALFKFSTSLRNKFVNSAKLHVPIRMPSMGQYGTMLPLRVNVFRRYANGSLGPAIVSKFVELESSAKTIEQVEIPLPYEVVEQWIQTSDAEEGNGFAGNEERPEPERRAQYQDEANTPSLIGVYAEALIDDRNLVQHPSKESNERGFFVELEMITVKSGRSRRNLNICRAGQNNTQKCCLYDLVIDFEKIGWSFVIAPKRYNAYICSGECSGIGQGAGIMTRQHAASAAKIDHYQCCHPKEYAGITILFVKEDNELMAREVPNMVAKECGCT